jgi:DNA-binding transcriptional MerR regulator
MLETNEPFVISGEGVLTPPDRDRWVTPEMAASGPTYAAKEVAEVFFAKSTNWLRKRLWERREDWDPDRTDAGHRRFNLAQIEDLAHLLLRERAMKPSEFAMIIRHVKASAIQHGLQIGDTGFLLAHWNGQLPARRQLILLVLERLELWDAGREPAPFSNAEYERAVDEAARAIRRGETLHWEVA